MTNLSSQSCINCSPEAQPLSNTQLAEYLQQLIGWQIVQGTDANSTLQKLEKTYSFDNYQQSIEFTNRVAELAETEDHHPALLTEWGKVRVTWWTHSIGGLHRNDFICAAKTDLLV
mgnify:CR=1 FL=1|jgi:4a-hydroxytetrahydrobiopterin dehydratase